ncbi:hypothetical protein HPP92_012573 [Vanilla planifolia]|uniref:Uncharacterized protein n=1 Tax=Vanilla planifolia TaxID=51239 RepID=A0A835QXR9_VANPL|nr:hypothetical protein HPP92_012573 [Vanilla planifolia]
MGKEAAIQDLAFQSTAHLKAGKQSAHWNRSYACVNGKLVISPCCQEATNNFDENWVID